MVNILTGTAFDSPKRLNHREDEVALEFPSSVSSRARGLVALRAIYWRAVKGGDDMQTVKFTATVDQGFWNDIKAQIDAQIPNGSIIFRKSPRKPGVYALMAAIKNSNGSWGDSGLRWNYNARYVTAANFAGQYIAVRAGDEFYVVPCETGEI